MKPLKKFMYPLVFIVVVFFFFYQFLIRGLLPIPSDTIIGLYNPFRDLYAKDYPRGMPFKNFLVTDPVRQQYPWKNLTVMLEKNFELPLWNPYSFSGAPLLANFQSSPFYPLNILFLIPAFSISWSFFIMLQLLLAGLFLYLYLKNLRLSSEASLFGAITWAFCGFSIAWMEWGNVIHTALWLPLILLAIDKIESGIKNNELKKWGVIYVIALASSFFAGHLQTFFYLYVFSSLYLLVRVFQSKNKVREFVLFIILNLLFIILAIPQWLPTLRFILLSNRVADINWINPGWFIPYQNLSQFIAPDFFGNPSTLNYFGIWNYGEFVGYVGTVSLILALYAIIMRRDKKTYFFLIAVVVSLLFATQNLISQTPFQLKIPFISTVQPTRLLFIIDLSLSVLAALGLDYFIKTKKRIIIPIVIIGIFLGCLWGSIIFGRQLFPNATDILVTKNNLKLPTVLFVVSAVTLLGIKYLKNKKYSKILVIFLFLILIMDLFRFGWKFTPFTSQAYLFPSTKITRYLKAQPGVFRIAATDSRILPPNFSVIYQLQSIEGYDPLYLEDYAAFIAAMERGKPDISLPYGFNRIITPHNYNSPLFSLLNVKYVLAFDELPKPKFDQVLVEGTTRLYKNNLMLPRAFFVKDVVGTGSNQETINKLYTEDISRTAVVQNLGKTNLSVGIANITEYEANKVVIETQNSKDGFLVLTDIYYPTWDAYIDGEKTTIYKTNYTFRGVLIPAGNHVVKFKIAMF